MTTTQKKPGFGGQYVEELFVGKFTAEDGTEVDVTPELLEGMVRNYDIALHEAPAVIGHPETNAPAFGWVADLKVVDGKLVNQFVDVDPTFEEMVRTGKFKKRSASIYTDPNRAPGGKAPYLKHIGFLGAKAPAVKGLKNIQFSEGDSIEIEIEGDITFSEGVTMTDDEKKAQQEAAKKTALEAVTDFFKRAVGIGIETPAPATAVAFSEADREKLIKDAVASATAQFSEELKKRDTTIEGLLKSVGNQVGSSKRAEILSFCESVGASKLIPAFKNMGVVQFMEMLASIEDSKDTKVSVVSFAEEGGKEVEKKVEVTPLEWFQSFMKALPSYVSFGEKFGDLKVQGDGSEIVDQASLASMRKELDLPENGKAAAKSQ